jgi:hypothetical protein
MNRLNDIVIVLTTKFADRQETKKGLKGLEKQLVKIHTMIASKDETQKEDDAMLNKKHLCGFSCACCEKDLINFYYSFIMQIKNFF